MCSIFLCAFYLYTSYPIVSFYVRASFMSAFYPRTFYACIFYCLFLHLNIPTQKKIPEAWREIVSLSTLSGINARENAQEPTVMYAWPGFH